MDIKRRKLQKIKGSYLVTLPSKWIKNFKLKKGAEVDIVTNNAGFLEIFPKYEEKKENKKAFIIWDDNIIKRFSRAYFAGNDFIEIKFQKPVSKAKMDFFNNFLSKFLNVDIVEEDSEKIVVQNFGVKNVELHTAFKRMYFLARAMFEDVIKGETAHLIERDNQVDKFYFLVVMQVRTYISKGEYVSQRLPLIKALDYRMVSEKIERIADILKSMKTLSEKEKKLAEELFDYFNSAVTVFMKDDFEKSCELNNIFKKLVKKIKNPDLKQILFLIKDISDLIR